MYPGYLKSCVMIFYWGVGENMLSSFHVTANWHFLYPKLRFLKARESTLMTLWDQMLLTVYLFLLQNAIWCQTSPPSGGGPTVNQTCCLSLLCNFSFKSLQTKRDETSSCIFNQVQLPVDFNLPWITVCLLYMYFRKPTRWAEQFGIIGLTVQVVTDNIKSPDNKPCCDLSYW